MVNDPQQITDAELRLAFSRTLPRRVAALQRRLRALAKSGWDVNLLRVLQLETGQLAGTAGRYDLIDSSELLATLEQVLARCAQIGELPNPGQARAILAQLDRLDSISGSKLSQTKVMSRSKEVARASLAEPLAELNGLPAASNVSASVRPPLEFLPYDQAPKTLRTYQGSVSGDVAPLSAGSIASDFEFLEQIGSVEASDMSEEIVTGSAAYDVTEDLSAHWTEGLTPITAEQPAVPDTIDAADEVTLPARDDRKLLYYLAQTRPVVLLDQLEPYYEVEFFDVGAQFIEVLNAVSPEAILISGDQLNALEQLQPIIEKARRHKQGKPLPFFVVADSDQIEHRLAALRAGADAFLQADTAPEEIRRRLDELLAHGDDKAFRILVLEDDQSQSMLTSRILQKAGMKVQVQPDPLEVMPSLEAFEPDLILMDLYMPGCDGMELTSIIREHGKFLHTPIVFLSGESDTDKHFDALLAGGDDFLSKPVRPKHLISAVTNRIRRSRALVARQRREPSKQDPSTGLYQRSHVMEQINAALVSAPPEPADAGGVLLVEVEDPQRLKRRVGVDGLETINRQVGSVLASLLRSRDLLCRYADGIFALLLPNRSLQELADAGQQMIQRVASADIGTSDKVIGVSITVGICGLSRQFGDAGAIVAAAERTAAKGIADGQKLTVHQLQGAADTGNAQRIEKALRAALKQHQLQVVYQPIVALDGNDQERYQSLARLPLNDGKGESIAAAQFIGIAERAGIVAHVDRQMLARAVAVLDRRHRAGRKTQLFVSQSALLQQDAKRLAWLSQLLKLRHIKPRHLILEFRADALLENPDSITAVTELQQLNVGLCLASISDSKAHLELTETLEPSYVKVQPLPALGEGSAKRLIARLHEKNLKVIMPTVEDARTAANLWTYGIDFIQGNFVQQPEPKLAYHFAGD